MEKYMERIIEQSSIEYKEEKKRLRRNDKERKRKGKEGTKRTKNISKQIKGRRARHFVDIPWLRAVKS